MQNLSEFLFTQKPEKKVQYVFILHRGMSKGQCQASHHGLLFLCLQIRSSPIITSKYLSLINEFCELRYKSQKANKNK